MKGEGGRRRPLSGLLDRFSMDSLRAQRDRDKSREDVHEISVRVKSGDHKHKRREVNAQPKRGVTKRPMAKVVAQRRQKRKGTVRPNKAKRVRYLLAQRRRTGA